MECEAVCKIATKLEDIGASYRIISPYDAQRATMETALKAHGLNWHNKCYNVDSFQGKSFSFFFFSKSLTLIVQQEMKMTTSSSLLSGPETLAFSKTFAAPMSCSVAVRRPCTFAAIGTSSSLEEARSLWLVAWQMHLEIMHGAALTPLWREQWILRHK